MFNIKATFGQETRRLVCSPADSFPTHQELYEQLSKVFPITRSFYLTSVFFSPGTTSPGTILIAAQVHNEDRWNSCIQPYRHKLWPGASLRFTVNDDSVATETSAPFIPADSQASTIRGKGRECNRVRARIHHPRHPVWQSPAPPIPPTVPVPPPRWGWTLPTPAPGRWDPNPPPTAPGVGVPMDVDSSSSGTPRPGHHCCNVEQGKANMQRTLAGFMNNFDQIMMDTFGNDYRNPASSNTSDATPPVAPPVAPQTTTPVHTGVICDVCESTIRGIRHKCLDCPDYDMCTPCIADRRSQHAASHEFFKIEEPGHVIVHTVFNGEEEQAAFRRAVPTPPAPVAPSAVVVHHATCDLCDSRIRGERYKCLGCPDFDTCGDCFKITPEQHPGHSFVKVKDLNSIIVRRGTIPQHAARCDGCQKAIYGVRYKCMTCDDFDLCEQCESLPIPVHPIFHHMLKMKTPLAPVPPRHRHSDLIQLNPFGDSHSQGLPTPPPSHILPPAQKDREEAVKTPTLPGISAESSLIPDINMLFQGDVTATPVEEAYTVDSPVREKTPRIPGSLSPTVQADELWPEMKQMLNDILQPVPVGHAASITETENAKPALTNPVETNSHIIGDIDAGRHLDVLTTASPVGSNSDSQALLTEPEVPLKATFVSDNNIPDGQVFPPGAEFVKSWKIRNDGTRDWPESSQLVFVAGDRLATQQSQNYVKIGKVCVGQEVDVWTTEMKAPEAPGKYVTYWRLSDGLGTYFGHSLWADITVAEPVSDEDKSTLSSSSIVVMPAHAPEKSNSSSHSQPGPASQATQTSITATDTLSEMGSVDSDLSVLEAPSSPSLSAVSVTWEETRQQRSPLDPEYVVLYDDSSEDGEL